MQTDLTGRKVLAIATNYGVEQDELDVPVQHLRTRGAVVTVAAAEPGAIQTLVNDKDTGKSIDPDTTLDGIDAREFDLLLVPGGTINADKMRLDGDAVAIVKAFAAAGKPIAAICHAPWTLIEAGVVAGRTMTSFWSLESDLRNAGADWKDEPNVVDDSGEFVLITSRNPDDLDAFTKAIDAALAPA